VFYLAHYFDAFKAVLEDLIFAVNHFILLFPQFEEGFLEVHDNRCSPGLTG
jgi:hypothetical protein